MQPDRQAVDAAKSSEPDATTTASAVRRGPVGNAGLSSGFDIAKLAAIYGWGSREVQDAHDYLMGTTPDE